jgi:hypothetical protein
MMLISKKKKKKNEQLPSERMNERASAQTTVDIRSWKVYLHTGWMLFIKHSKKKVVLDPENTEKKSFFFSFKINATISAGVLAEWVNEAAR